MDECYTIFRNQPTKNFLDPNLHRPCNLEKIEPPEVEPEFELLPCQKEFRLRPEDEISVDSIISALLAPIEPSITQLRKCQWGIKAKEMHNEKQAIIFEEHLYISQLKNTNCKLSEEHKIFLQRELQHVGNFCLNIEESYDGYVVLSNSKMRKGMGLSQCGHNLRGKYDNRFLLIVEKRTEFDYVDKARVEKLLEARNKDDKQVVATRETKINGESQKFKATINIQGRDGVFVLDGGVMLLMRYLIVNHFTGVYEYYSMNLFGKIIRCSMRIEEERKTVRVFYRLFNHAICVINTQYFNDVPEEVSETYFQANGHIILHFWHGYNFVLHATRAPQPPPETILPKMELMWKADHHLQKQYQLDTKLTYENAMEYLCDHPEVADFLHDYILELLKFKPDKVLEFSVHFFQNMKKQRHIL